jgi:hypothetical protein
MDFVSHALSFAGSLFVGVLVTQEIGRRIGIRRIRREGEDFAAGAGVVDGAVFALLGLLIAFTFSSAASRFDERRKLIVEETNDIGTAYLRLNLLPPDAAAHLRGSFREYLDSRLATYRALPDIEAAKAGLARSAEIQQQIWLESLAASANSQPATMLLLPALNSMFDITTVRTGAALNHPPSAIYWLLYALALLGGALAGYDSATTKDRDWMHATIFAITLAGAVYVILDLEYPRLGLIRVDQFDQPLVDLRHSME